MSIAGGVDLAFERGAAVGCSAIQIFTKSNNQWAARPLPDDEIERFREARARTGIAPVVAHDSYLINLCSPDDGQFARSIDACAEELARCDRLGIEDLVTHPGSHMGRGAEFGIGRLVEAIDEVHRRLPVLRARIVLETMAGQGGAVGARFEEIAAVLARVRHPERLGVCFDTCHVFAAGYELRTRAGYDDTLRRFDGEIGLARLRAVHVNDSKKDLGCRVDRHEQIGKGYLGLEAFRLLMNDDRLHAVPFLLETPKGEDCREDVENLTTLMGLVAGGAPGKRRRGARRAATA
jgi:deoxyribonuclease-4